MAIPERQLETWSHQGATASANAIYNRIRAALKNDATLSTRDFDVFLQGSYRNSTNIRGDSDVDVVAMLTETYMPNYSELDAHTRVVVEGRVSPATYMLDDFRCDVSNAIRRAFPNHNITEGGKSIKIPGTSNNIPADVVPCLEYRLYYKTQSGLVCYAPGVWLKDFRRNHRVNSFPKQSYDNGVAKHWRTNEWYKRTIRIFKNARGWMEDNGLIQSGTASSYTIECLLYNVPDQKFGNSYGGTFFNVLNWLINADLKNFVCQNGIQYLFRNDRRNLANAHAFICGLIRMWNHWL